MGGRALIVAAVAFWLAGCVRNPMPPSWPLQGQTEETMVRDREECERIATKGADGGSYFLVGGETSRIGQQLTRQRHASFNACMASRGYRTDEP